MDKDFTQIVVALKNRNLEIKMPLSEACHCVARAGN